MNEQITAPDALLLMGSRCPWCPGVLQALKTLRAEGMISGLETVNVEENPEVAAELGVRSVPWLRLGPFELEGNRTLAELRDWAGKANSRDGMAMYLSELIGSGEIDKSLELVKKHSGHMRALLALFADPETALNILIGISAIMEHLQGTETLAGISAELRELLSSDQPRVRGDACYYLSLSGLPEAAEWIRPLLEDEDENVREIATDSLKEIS